MKAFKLKYENGTFIDVIANNDIEVIKAYDLCCRENDSIRLVELSGEQAAIVFSNLDKDTNPTELMEIYNNTN